VSISPPVIENRYYLGPGHIVVTDKPSEIWMVLGSCVSLLFFDERSGTTAACHVQLPSKKRNTERCPDECPDPCYNEQPDPNEMKFLGPAFDYMLRQLQRRGIAATKTRVTLIGGSNIMQINRANSIGEQNVNEAHRLLRDNSIPLSCEQTGGNTGRTIIFNTVSGKLTIKKQLSVAENEEFVLQKFPRPLGTV